LSQFKFLTSWYQVPIKDCIEGIKPYLFDYANKEFFIYSAVDKSSCSIVTIGFCKDDTNFTKPIVLSYTGLSEEDLIAFCNELKEHSQYFNLCLQSPNFKQGEYFCCNELTDYFKEVLLRRYVNGVEYD